MSYIAYVKERLEQGGAIEKAMASDKKLTMAIAQIAREMSQQIDAKNTVHTIEADALTNELNALLGSEVAKQAGLITGAWGDILYAVTFDDTDGTVLRSVKEAHRQGVSTSCVISELSNELAALVGTPIIIPTADALEFESVSRSVNNIIVEIVEKDQKIKKET